MTPCRPHSYHPRRRPTQRGIAATLGPRNNPESQRPPDQLLWHRHAEKPAVVLLPVSPRRRKGSAVLVPRRRKRQRPRKRQRRRKLARPRKPERQCPRPSAPREAEAPNRHADRLIQLLESARGCTGRVVPLPQRLPARGAPRSISSVPHSEGSPTGGVAPARAARRRRRRPRPDAASGRTGRPGPPAAHGVPRSPHRVPSQPFERKTQGGRRWLPLGRLALRPYCASGACPCDGSSTISSCLSRVRSGRPEGLCRL